MATAVGLFPVSELTLLFVVSAEFWLLLIVYLLLDIYCCCLSLCRIYVDLDPVV